VLRLAKPTLSRPEGLGDATKEEADVSDVEGRGVFFGVEGQMSGGPAVGGAWRLPWAWLEGISGARSSRAGGRVVG